jgi:hypothetical protein
LKCREVWGGGIRVVHVVLVWWSLVWGEVVGKAWVLVGVQVMGAMVEEEVVVLGGVWSPDVLEAIAGAVAAEAVGVAALYNINGIA